jgi:hypothetical protein
MWFVAAMVVGLATTGASAQSPQIARVGQIVRGGSFRIFGENVKGGEVHLWQPDCSPEEIGAAAEELPEMSSLPTKPPESAERATVRAAYPQVAFASGSWGTGSQVTVVWRNNEDGFSRPYLANQPEVWLASHHQAMPGERVQLFGRNLARGSSNVLPQLCLKSPNSGRLYRAVWGKFRARGPLMFEGDHRVEFVLPEDIKPSRYEAWYHNGSGGKHGWSEPTPLEILKSRDLIEYAAAAWNRTGVQADSQTLSSLHVHRIPQALCDGITDATEELQQAIDTVSDRGRGIVLLPPGTCGITKTIDLKRGVVLRGAGRGATTLTLAFGKRFVSNDRESGNALVRIGTQAGISDMEVRGGPRVDKLVLVRNYPEDEVPRNADHNATEDWWSL